MKILILNGPNLNLLGSREPHIYGDQNFETFLGELRRKFPEHAIEYFQSNVEGEIINRMHDAVMQADAVILNAGGYTHTSVAIADAVAAIALPVVEVHISNPEAREAYRHRSLLAGKSIGSVSGFGLKSYELAIRALES